MQHVQPRRRRRLVNGSGSEPGCAPTERRRLALAAPDAWSPRPEASTPRRREPGIAAHGRRFLPRVLAAVGRRPTLANHSTGRPTMRCRPCGDKFGTRLRIWRDCNGLHVPRPGSLGQPSATPHDLCGFIVGEDHDERAGGGDEPADRDPLEDVLSDLADLTPPWVLPIGRTPRRRSAGRGSNRRSRTWLRWEAESVPETTLDGPGRR